jgi:hypothetical protein
VLPDGYLNLHQYTDDFSFNEIGLTVTVQGPFFLSIKEVIVTYDYESVS